jgi:hypothetical protein
MHGRWALKTFHSIITKMQSSSTAFYAATLCAKCDRRVPQPCCLTCTEPCAGAARSSRRGT